MNLTASVLIPSFGRPNDLTRCLRALREQDAMPSEVIVVWQANDEPTRDATLQLLPEFEGRIQVVHSPTRGVVPAENVALRAATGEIAMLIDDDAVAPPNWIACHLSHYEDDRVGAVGGPAVNHRPGGSPFPTRTQQPFGRLAWWGKVWGNMYDHPSEWRTRPPIEVDHLVGYNLSFRRCLIEEFETHLREYWQLFEMDACLTVRSQGFKVLFDFGNVVDHYPTNTAFAGGRDGDLAIKIYNPTYNGAFVRAKHAKLAPAVVSLIYLLGCGTTAAPGVLATLLQMLRGENPWREIKILMRCWKETFHGWLAGRAQRRKLRRR